MRKVSASGGRALATDGLVAAGVRLPADLPLPPGAHGTEPDRDARQLLEAIEVAPRLAGKIVPLTRAARRRVPSREGLADGARRGQIRERLRHLGDSTVPD